MHPIPDKGEVAVDFPDKFYMGQFGHSSSFDAGIEADGVVIRLRSGTGDERREAQIHLHHLLFAEILDEIGRAISQGATIDGAHRAGLLASVTGLRGALEQPPSAP